VTHVPFNNVVELDAAITRETAALFIEPVQGEAGIYPADDAFLQAARELTRERGALLVADEIQSGFRTGAPFAMSQAAVVPDILCTAKAIGNGFPVGVTMVTEAISSQIPAGAHGTTFGANPLACRAAVTTLGIFEQRDLYAQTARVGERLMANLRAMSHPKIRDVRGRGLMIGVELKERVTPTLRALQDRGVLALPASPVVFRLLPPLIWEDQHADEFVAALEAALA
jgi:acetylornithine/LysW-gamma-L-lysine aminotransferase